MKSTQRIFTTEALVQKLFTKHGSDAKKEKGMVEIDFGPTLDVLKRGIFQCIQGNPVRNNKHHKI